jgi:hypothetical protein
MYLTLGNVASLAPTIDLAHVVLVEDHYASAQTTSRNLYNALSPLLEQAAWMTGWTFDVQVVIIPPPKCLMLWPFGSSS